MPAARPPDVTDCSRQSDEHHLHLAADQVSERGRWAAIGHITDVNFSHHLEQLARDMGAAPVTR
ncbi:MAG TPA: hypothetical protein VKB38_04455, partial [Terracidiphilus sp.]|nr:hypothetical protein [Terracidiphilus sp.]